jgi:protein phosphatase 1 regulatory subunit 37
MTKAYTIIEELQTSIQITEDPVKLEELLGVNDQLLVLVKQVPSSGQVRPQLTLEGLGLGLSFDTEHDDVKDGVGSASESRKAVDVEEVKGEEEDEEVLTPTTPRVDKGKGRAEPEEEELEKVLSPSYVIDSDEGEDEVVDEEDYFSQEMRAVMTSPTER